MRRSVLGTLVVNRSVVDDNPNLLKGLREVWVKERRCYPFYDDIDGKFLILSPDYPHNNGFVHMRKQYCEDIVYKPGTMWVSPISSIFDVSAVTETNLRGAIFVTDNLYRVRKETESHYTLYSEDLPENDGIGEYEKFAFDIGEISGFDFGMYANQTGVTAVYPKESELEYLGFGLVGEAGEIANKLGKIFRDDGGVASPERIAQIEAELGDIQWFVARMMKMFKLDPNKVLLANLTKLRHRQARGMLKGDGDNRGEQESTGK